MADTESKRNLALIVYLKQINRTQRWLLAKAKIKSESRLSRIINGHIAPKDTEVARICSALKVTQAEIGF